MISFFYYDIVLFAGDLKPVPAVIIRNLAPETHRALKLRAAKHDRSTEAEIRAILDAAVKPEGRLQIGAIISERSRTLGLTNDDVEALTAVTEKRPAQPMSFE